MSITMAHRDGVTARSRWVQGWAQHGICGKAEPDALFARGTAQQAAKKVCLGCPVIAECLADSLDNRTQFGVWGGMTERQRRVLLKHHPQVKSWRAAFEADRIHHSATALDDTAPPDRRTCRHQTVVVTSASG